MTRSHSFDRLEVPPTPEKVDRKISRLPVSFAKLFSARTVDADGLTNFAIFSHFPELSFLDPFK
jgi:hypothetical protein